MRLIGLLLAFALVVVVARELAQDAGDDEGSPTTPVVAESRLPPELRGLFSGVDDAARSVLPTVLGGKGEDAPAAPRMAPPFADAGPAGARTRVRRTVRRELRADGTRARVLAWQGVIVQGDRAVVRADVQVRERTGTGRMVPRPPRRVTLGLRRGDGWRIVSGR